MCFVASRQGSAIQFKPPIFIPTRSSRQVGRSLNVILSNALEGVHVCHGTQGGNCVQSTTMRAENHQMAASRSRAASPQIAKYEPVYRSIARLLFPCKNHKHYHTHTFQIHTPKSTWYVTFSVAQKTSPKKVFILHSNCLSLRCGVVAVQRSRYKVPSTPG